MLSFFKVNAINFLTNVGASLFFHVNGHVSGTNVATNMALLYFLLPEINQTKYIKVLLLIMGSCIIQFIIQFMHNSHEIIQNSQCLLESWYDCIFNQILAYFLRKCMKPTKSIQKMASKTSQDALASQHQT